MNNTSPVIKKSVPTMTFPDAMVKVIAGQKVTRLEWDDKEVYGYLKDGLLMIHIINKDPTKGKDRKWIVSDGDMLNNDWVVVKEAKVN